MHLFLCAGGDRLRELALREGDEDEENDLDRDRERDGDRESEPEYERDGDEEPDGDADGLLGLALPGFAIDAAVSGNGSGKAKP